MKSDLWAIFGFTMILVMVLSAGFVMLNELILVVGSPGIYFNSDTLLNAYRVMMCAVAGFSVAVVNIMVAGKK